MGNQPAAKNAGLSVAVVSDTYPPVVGGAEMDIQRVSAELIQRGYRVEVLCAGGAPMPLRRRWVDPMGVPVRILTSSSSGRADHIRFAARVALSLWSMRHHCDIVYFSMQGLHLAAGLPVARFCGKRILMKVHGSTVIPAMANSRAGRWELKWLKRWASKVMVLNDEMVQEALDQGFESHQLLHMPNPIDVEMFRPLAPGERSALRERLGLNLSARVLTYVGRLSHEKGLLELVHGFALAARQSPDLLLCLVGDGAFRRTVEEQVAALGIPAGQVRFVGRVSAHEVPLWLQAADAFVLVSPNEGFSCALAEAMAAGLPAIVSAIPANLQLVRDGEHGFTVPFGNAASLAAAIEKIMQDDSLRARMREAARTEIVTNYSLDKIVDRYEALFEQVLAETGR